jgi:hypothetical protein
MPSYRRRGTAEASSEEQGDKSSRNPPPVRKEATREMPVGEEMENGGR